MNFMKNFIFLKLFYCFLILFVNSISNKLLADWPQFRGPTGDGRVNVISHPKKWSTKENLACLLYTSPSPRDATLSRMPSSA